MSHMQRRRHLVARASLLAPGACGAAGVARAQDVAAPGSTELQEIVVTATRSAQSLSRVPISVAAMTQEQMDDRGVKQFGDVVRFTPGLSFNPTVTGSSDVAVRGVSSNAGASTTGIYVDDVPIQVRQVGFGAGASLPVIFDLERVEVLRGPQGTLFGAGSEGGTVRFIQPNPSLTDFAAHVRVEGSSTHSAAESYEAGVAVGGPLLQDRLGFRLSALYRKEGGWIDRVPATLTVVDPTGASYGEGLRFEPTGEGDKNFNDVTTKVVRLAVAAAPAENLTITPSVFYQVQNVGVGADSYWLSGSDPSAGRFVVPDFSPGAPSAANGLTALTLPDTSKGRRELFVSALNVEWDAGPVTVYSTTSFVEQDKRQYMDFTIPYALQYYVLDVPLAGEKGITAYDDEQQAYTQEIRIQSNADEDSRLKWVAGFFYSKTRQVSEQLLEENAFYHAKSYFGIPDLTGADPFGPGYLNFHNVWGAPMIGESGSYFAYARTNERQAALFGQIDFRLTEQLSVTAGARYSKNKLRYTLDTVGPENNLNAPFGIPCPTGPTCPFGSGVLEPVYANGSLKTSETAFTPKVSVNYRIDDQNLLYASVSKGFRPGGAQLPLPAACDADLIGYGYTDASGRPDTPATYRSDSVWSYEVGSKNKFFGGKLAVAGSAYAIKWKNIQTSLLLPTCLLSFTDNLGSATVKGFDLQLDASPARGLVLSASVGYTDATLDEGLVSQDGAVVLAKGSAISGAGAPWRVVLSGQYERPLTATLDGYVRADVTYSSRPGVSGTRDPDVFNYDPLIPRIEASTIVNARLGVTRGGTDLSVFATNLFDTHPLTGAGRTLYVWSASTIRPRTVGVTLTHRY